MATTRTQHATVRPDVGMTTSPVDQADAHRYRWQDSGGPARRPTVRDRLTSVMAAGVPLVVLSAIVLLRAGGVDAAAMRVTGPRVEVPADAGARTRLAAAATAIQSALAKGGGGITFEVVQTQTLVAKPGGPRLEIHDPVPQGGRGSATRA